MTSSRRTWFALGISLIVVPTTAWLLTAEVLAARRGQHATGAFVVAIAGGMVLGYVLGRLDERKTLLLDELPAVWTVALVAITSFLSVAVRSATGSYRTILFGACGGFFLTMYVFVLKAIRAGRLPPPRPEPHEYAGARPQAITPGRLAIVAGVLVFGVLVGTAAGTVSAGVGGVIIAAAAVAVATSLFWLWRRFFGGRRVV